MKAFRLMFRKTIVRMACKMIRKTTHSKTYKRTQPPLLRQPLTRTMGRRVLQCAQRPPACIANGRCVFGVVLSVAFGPLYLGEGKNSGVRDLLHLLVVKRGAETAGGAARVCIWD